MTKGIRAVNTLVATMAAAIFGVVGTVHAGSATYGGFLDDSGNSALIGSAAWLGTPPGPGFTDSLGNDYAFANNVALYSISLATNGSVQFDSNGFGLGGVDPYFTLFSGTGSGAAFLGSNYGQAFSTGGDFDLTFSLLAGDYTFAVGAFANMSFAENWGIGTLGDGFIGLGVPSSLGDPGTLAPNPYYAYYEVVVTTSEGPGPSVPEPSTLLLALLGLGTYAGLRRSRK